MHIQFLIHSYYYNMATYFCHFNSPSCNQYLSIYNALFFPHTPISGVIMGEFLVSKEGIGYLIIYGTQVFNLDLVLAGVVILVILSYIFYKPISLLEKYVLKNN